MKYLSVFPFIDYSLDKPFLLDENEWPEFKMTDGLNVFEEGDKMVIQAAVPGIPNDKLKITFKDGVLKVYGEVQEKGKEEQKKKKIIHQWNKVSTFDYETVLPKEIDPKSIDAKLKEGVVTIKAQIIEEPKSKEIQVKVM